ncbi:MFS transporter [Oscillatoria sp. FACHB-1407]|uniref:MFS transporter n=1 Tax=Oscillatoria sp. FACHB-1407 TaxID=2692847 RepID=UPI0016861464|nr:MFS transporter [Oscillatoria sp. FACHB-1407]MBD2459732.1 MFS transporter [Oscillatoria sp. FACHB-1407]
MDLAPAKLSSTSDIPLANPTEGNVSVAVTPTGEELCIAPPEEQLRLPESPESNVSPTVSKEAIRTSLRASTLDGVFATIFSNIAGGVLLSNFLVELNASPVEVGMLSSIPMVANLLQPLGAYLADRSHSRHWYCLWIYGPSRLFWLVLILAILLFPHQFTPDRLVKLTLAIVLASHFLGALGSASWLSWLAALVPRRLRGRYFGIRNSAASLTNLISVPIFGVIISNWRGDAIQGYGAVLALGLFAGIVSLGFQYFMVDVDPQVQKATALKSESVQSSAPTTDTPPSGMASSDVPPAWFQDYNFLRFLLYFGGWMFAVNLSAPFFNLYLLDNLNLDVSLVTLYNSLSAGANLLMLIVWGRLADRSSNRSILIVVGIAVALTPVLWLGTGTDSLSIWLWLPLLHILGGGTWAAIDLCSNNIQLGVAPVYHQATYFAIAAAIAGVSGALGTTVGGYLAEFTDYGGLLGLFALSSVLRLIALLPLIFVHEQRGQTLRQMTRILFSAQTEE